MGHVRAVARDDHGATGTGEQADRLVDRSSMCHGREQLRTRTRSGALADRLPEEVRGQAEVHGTSHAAAGPSERLGHRFCQLVDVGDLPRPLAQRRGDLGLAHLLLGSAAGRAHVPLATEQHDRAAGGMGRRQPGERVGVPRSPGHQRDRRQSGGAGIRVGRHDGASLGARVHQSDPRIVEPFVRGEDVVAA